MKQSKKDVQFLKKVKKYRETAIKFWFSTSFAFIFTANEWWFYLLVVINIVAASYNCIKYVKVEDE